MPSPTLLEPRWTTTGQRDRSEGRLGQVRGRRTMAGAGADWAATATLDWLSWASMVPQRQGWTEAVGSIAGRLKEGRWGRR